MKDEINAIESEAGVVATLIHHPEFCFYSENLLPNHFTNKNNQCVYQAICMLTQKGIKNIDAYNIIEVLSSSEATKRYSESLTVETLQEMIDMSDVISRHTLEEYKLLVNNVLDAAFRRDTLDGLNQCIDICKRQDVEDVGTKISTIIDDVMMGYSSIGETKEYKDCIEDYWEETKSRQVDGYSGIPFRFIPALNDFATIEPGELFIFAAEAKMGKSMMLLSTAVDLLKQGYSVLYIDSELNSRLFTARLISHLTGIRYKNLTSGNYSEEDGRRIKQAIEWVKSKNFNHLYVPLFDMTTIYTAVKKAKHKDGLDVLIVDYFKSSGDGDTAWDSYAELGKFTDLVKNRIAGDMGIAAVGAVQATSTGKVADSAKIGRNTSTLAIIQNKTDEEIAEDGEACGNKKLKIVLNRNGPQHASGEWIDLDFQGDYISYKQAKQQHIPQSPY